jgi:ABC-2 type transport system permease protein
MKQTLAITRKELSAYFGSPMALIFVGVFLAVTFFAFFWVDAFFARGIADARPLFRWMPVLMIFLVAALTMRQWSEEQRSGTLEVLLTLPLSKGQFVVGKFLAVMTLVALALALTLVLPITVSLIGALDWGPVVGGYVAALLMAAAYTAIGLFLSSRTDNQLVSLTLTVMLCGLFYLVGAGTVTDFVPPALGDIFRAIGAGSRFDSIERGVIDLRDLVYYLSLTGIFLTLNVLSLESKRWSKGQSAVGYRRKITLTSLLIIANLVMVNFWLYPLSMLRADLTADRSYSLSRTTRDLLAGLSEPLTIRAYISERTHPLLKPLAPQITDLLREYEIAGRGKVTAEVIDPIKDPEKETEANQTYGIQPSPFQVTDRHESSVINSYFDILVRYGDQHEVLNFRDLMEVEARRDGTAEVRLRNPEYDLTRAVKKAVYGFQSVDELLASLDHPVKLTLLATSDTLPEALQGAPDLVKKVAEEFQSKSNGKFTFEMINPDAPGSPLNRQQIQETYSLRPIARTLVDSRGYYLDMLLDVGGQAGAGQNAPGSAEKSTTQVLSPAGEFTEVGVRTAIESALKRSSTGFLKTVGLWTPPEISGQNMFGQEQPPLRSWQALRKRLAEDYAIVPVTLSTGQVPAEVDVLVVVSPQGMGDKEKYAIDQFLMRGGSVVIAQGSYSAAVDELAGKLILKPVEGGLTDLLAHYGVGVDNSLVMDPQNEPFPAQVERQVGNTTIQEVQAVSYPPFVDVRADGMDQGNPVVSKLSAVTVNYASPVNADDARSQGRQVDELLKSSSKSWLRTNTDITSDQQKYPGLGFPVEGDQSSRPLAVAVTGSFQSYFKDKPSPLVATAEVSGAAQTPTPVPGTQTGGTIESSPEAARLLVVGSSDFLTDFIFQVSTGLSGERYQNSLQFVQNAVDWSLEDLDLLGIRSRGTPARRLDPMTDAQQTVWEGVDYGLMLLALVGIGLAWYLRRKQEKPMTLVKPEQGDNPRET